MAISPNTVWNLKPCISIVFFLDFSVNNDEISVFFMHKSWSKLLEYKT